MPENTHFNSPAELRQTKVLAQNEKQMGADSSVLWPRAVPRFTPMAPPARLMVPLASRAGADVRAKPPGSAVSAGQTLVETAPESSHEAIAPFAGVLGAVQNMSIAGGPTVPCVELIVDQASITDAENYLNDVPPAADKNAGKKPDPASIKHNLGKSAAGNFNAVLLGDALVSGIDRLRRAGVQAIRHASPDLIGQMNHLISRPIDTIICTALDSNTGLRLNAAAAARRPLLVAAGVAALTRLTGARRSAIVTEGHAGSAWSRPLRGAVAEAKISIIELSNDYPQADPTLMLYTIAARKLRFDQLPTTQGVLLLDAVAAMAVGAAARGNVMTHVPVAVRDHARGRSHFAAAPVGTRIADILAHFGIDSSRATLRCGDMLRDLRAGPDSIIGFGELIVHVTPPEITMNPEPCIRCGWCRDICPTRVHPAMILDAAQKDNPSLAERAGIHACLDCGLCEHVCPSKLPLLDVIRGMRGK